MHVPPGSVPRFYNPSSADAVVWSCQLCHPGMTERTLAPDAQQMKPGSPEHISTPSSSKSSKSAFRPDGRPVAGIDEGL